LALAALKDGAKADQQYASKSKEVSRIKVSACAMIMNTQSRGVQSGF
jgi:hypothetical protein